MITNFKKFLNESDTNQVPDTQLHKYFQYYKMWCDENGIKYNFDKIDQKEIIKKGIKYAEEHNLPNMYYYDSVE